MDVDEIRRVGRGLEEFLAEFSDCFGRCDTESYLAVYVRGQNSGLQRQERRTDGVARGCTAKVVAGVSGPLELG